MAAVRGGGGLGVKLCLFVNVADVVAVVVVVVAVVVADGRGVVSVADLSGCVVVPVFGFGTIVDREAEEEEREEEVEFEETGVARVDLLL